MRILVLAFALIFPRPLCAQSPMLSLADGRDGTILFASSTPPGLVAYLGATKQPEAVVSGLLRLPAGSERVPAIVLSHSAGGVSTDRDLAWAERFTSIGLAAFVVDSFTPRGVKGFDNQPSLAASVADVYAALSLLATHPRIDPARVALMGFSRGGTVALTSALEPVRRVGEPAGARFAAHVALYPGCNTRYIAGTITRAPMLMLLGGADDQAPPEPCRRWGEWFRNLGAEIKVVTYPGAHHLFDGTLPLRFIPDAETAGTCDTEFDIEARVLRRTTRVRNSPASKSALISILVQPAVSISGEIRMPAPVPNARSRHSLRTRSDDSDAGTKPLTRQQAGRCPYRVFYRAGWASSRPEGIGSPNGQV